MDTPVSLPLHKNKQGRMRGDPHSVAKALAGTLGTIIENFEKDSEYHIPTLQEMENKVGQANAKAK